ncbi:MAG: ATPase [Deltaproteobacteria bacterium]|nr:MAG: ATPase [Deltaproteobacteria bacterium]
MKPSRVITALKLLIPLQQPVFLWGAPGVGKSQVVRQVAHNLDRELCDIRAVLLDPVDLRGLPKIGAANTTQWCAPSFLPSTGSGILFLDELNAAPPLVQAACYQLILDRRLGEYVLPDGWTVVAAGNRESDRAVTHRMPSALANRFVHLEFETDLDDWIAWAVVRDITPLLRAFLRFRPELLHAFDPTRGEKAFPSPRSWEFVAGILDAEPQHEVLHDLLSGTVGAGAASELMGFMRIYRNLPDVDDVLAAPETVPIPNDPATMYALCEAVARKSAPDTRDRIVTLAMRMPPEFSVLLVRDAVKHDNDVVTCPAFASWAAAHADVLM